MVKIIITFAIVIFGISFYGSEKLNALDSKLNSQIELTDSLNNKCVEKDSIILVLKDSLLVNNTLKPKVISKSIRVNNSSNNTNKEEVHTATWYEMHGSKTYSGERFHRDSLTAAYNFAKMGTYLRITNIYNNKSIVVRVTDKMGLKNKNRIDLSKKAFNSIANSSNGRVKVKVDQL